VYLTILWLENGQVYTFGNGQYGKLGDNDTTIHRRATPYLLTTLVGKNITSIAAGGAHSILLTGKNKEIILFYLFQIFFFFNKFK
jgi:alpha-tubulin suppressor-like RCC1 family protein